MNSEYIKEYRKLKSGLYFCNEPVASKDFIKKSVIKCNRVK